MVFRKIIQSFDMKEKVAYLGDRAAILLKVLHFRPTTPIIFTNPPFGQDMTQSQFLSRVYKFEFRVFLLLD